MKLSVVIPFYNLEKYVRPCVESVLSQTRTCELEVICVDDGSTDETPVLLDALRPHISVIHKPNGGEGSARNAGLAAATGDWITFLDGDDVWLSNYLLMAERLIATCSSADIIGLKYASFDDGMPLPTVGPAGETRIFDTRAEIPDEAILDIGVFPTLFRRSFVEGLRFSSLPLGADRLFMAKCFAAAASVVLAPVVVHGYRIRSGSMARAVWNGRKVESQLAYATGSLRALCASGKSLGRVGQAYLASLWLSDVPNRLARLPRIERRAAFQTWRATLREKGLLAGLPRYRLARIALNGLAFSQGLAMAFARLMRKGGVT